MIRHTAVFRLTHPASFAAPRAAKEQVRILRRIQVQLENAPDNARAIEADIAFHRALAAASGNQMFWLILDSLAEIGFASRQRTIGRVGKFTGIEHHSAILEAIERGDSEAAAAAMRHHITCAREDMKLRPKTPRSRT